jgi:energy-coupling factor transport system permease protein
MLKDVTLGQFYPGNTAIHRVDPRVKFILTAVYVVILFLVKNPIGYAPLAAFLFGAIAASKVPVKMVFKNLKSLIFFVILTGFLNLFFTKGEVIVSFWVLEISKEGIYSAVFMVLRILFLIVGTSLLTYTTSPIDLTDGMERLFEPFSRFKIPVHELSMMMSIALRFIPTLIEETDKIMSAQKARGANFETGGLIKRAKALIPVLVPLFVSAFRRADELAIAMECRCYHGGVGRTRLKIMDLERIDFWACLLMAVLCAAVLLLNRCPFLF